MKTLILIVCLFQVQIEVKEKPQWRKDYDRAGRSQNIAALNQGYESAVIQARFFEKVKTTEQYAAACVKYRKYREKYLYQEREKIWNSDYAKSTRKRMAGEIDEQILDLNNPTLPYHPVTYPGMKELYHAGKSHLFLNTGDIRQWHRRNGQVIEGVVGVVDAVTVIFIEPDGKRTKVNWQGLDRDDKAIIQATHGKWAIRQAK